MVGKYKVITLCGSTRFKDEFMEAQKRLTLEGNIVISVGLFGHAGDNEVWEGMSEDTLTKTKAMLDDMHKRRWIHWFQYSIRNRVCKGKRESSTVLVTVEIILCK